MADSLTKEQRSRRLKAICFEKRLTYEDLSNILGKSLATVTKKMNDVDTFTIDELRKMVSSTSMCKDDLYYIFLS